MLASTRLRKAAPFALALVAGFALFGCNTTTDRVDSGGVILSVSDFDGLPVLVGVNGSLGVIIGQITIENVVKDPLAVTSDLMNVEIQSYEVLYSRADGGTRVPSPMVRGIFGVAPVNGTNQYDNLPVMLIEQMTNEPLSDLLFENGGFDKETGNTSMSINFRLRFFGRTLAGSAVETSPIVFTVDFVP